MNTKSAITDTLEALQGFLQENIGMHYKKDICIPNSLLVVGNTPLAEEFISQAQNKFTIKKIEQIIDFSGNLGNFTINTNETSFNIAQIVFFSHFTSINNKSKKAQLGVFFANEYENKESLLDELESLVGEFSYENTIFYDKNKCQYHHRHKNEFLYCKSCVEVCPNMSISANDAKRELIFSDIDCILCGKCVGICPSGAMQKTNTSLYYLNKALKLYKNKIILICNQEDLDKEINEILQSKRDDIFPLPLPNINMLNEVYLLAILQESARVCVLKGEVESILKESIDYINLLYFKLFNQKQVIYFDIKEIPSNALLAHYHYEINKDEFSREMFANRLKYFVKEGDFGSLPNTKSILYTDIKIKESQCTLCMSCVESCNTKALIHSKDSFSLLLNPSICTACGYCIDNCPEKCIEMDLKGIALKESFFTYKTLAKDEPFKCIECGKVFASQKSIKKVKSLIAPLFYNDIIRQKTLECCSDCKVKVMFKGD